MNTNGKIYFVTIPVIDAVIADIAARKGVDAEALGKRFVNVMHAELGKVRAERKEAKEGKTAGQWAKIAIKKGTVSGSMTTRETLSLEDGQTISARAVDVYRFSAATVKFEEDFGAELVSQIPPAIENWIGAMADKLAEKDAPAEPAVTTK
jgi:hypothetical protein